jgi:hypothetical protein
MEGLPVSLGAAPSDAGGRRGPTIAKREGGGRGLDEREVEREGGGRGLDEREVEREGGQRREGDRS